MRYLVYSHDDKPLFELDETQLIEALQIETINAEHSLSLSTLQELEKEQRILIQDGAGKWREYVVVGISSEHAEQTTINTYYCVWSLQHDLEGTKVSSMPGVQNPVTAKAALDHALAGTKRWATGSVTRNTTGGVSMYFMSGWEALGKVVDVWGGEVDANIGVDEKGVVSRAVDLYDKQGNQAAKRRFDYARDMTSIKREVSDDLFACRIIPRGKGEETESGGYGRKITIEDVNDGRDYLEDEEAAQLVRLPAGSGYEYPTLIVDNENIETPEALLEWAQSVLTEYTRPRVSYEADVVQLARAGMDITGVALGDAVQCVDKTFSDDGLRIEGRIVKIEENLLDSSDIKLTIGNLGTSLADQFSLLQSQVATVQEYVQALQGDISTSEWIDNLLDRINAEVNATGGYTYITQGSGIRTYDKAVSDPLVGTEATSVVEIKGGTIRIANSKNAQGEWEWKTVFTSGHVAAELVTAANLTTGYIGSPASGNYWNLDTGDFYSAAYATKEDLDNLQVGGVNLLRGTNYPIITRTVANTYRLGAWMVESGGNGTGTVVELDDPPIPGIKYSRKITGHTSGNRDWQQAGHQLEIGQTYTYSLWARAITTQAALLCRIWQQTPDTEFVPARTYQGIGQEWTYIKKTFTYTGSNPATLCFGVGTLNGVTGDVEICAMQLEEGNIATSWSQNQWDIDVTQGQNLSPFFSQPLSDEANTTADALNATWTNDDAYWLHNIEQDVWDFDNGKISLKWTELEDGWVHVDLTCTTPDRYDWWATRPLEIEEGAAYTWLFEFRNNQSTGTTGDDVYMVSDAKSFSKNCEFYSNSVAATADLQNLYKLAAHLVGSDEAFEMRCIKASEQAGSSHWNTSAKKRTLARFCLYPRGAGTVYSFDMRISLYKGVYMGAYVPYAQSAGDFADTFATKTELQQTSSSIDARITNEINDRQTLVRAYGNGVLTANVGQNRGSLVNAGGSFDVVALTWSGNTPTVGAKLSSFGATTTSLGANSNSAVIDMCNGLGKISQEQVNSTTYFSIASDYEYIKSKYSSQLVSRENSNDLYGSKVKAQLSSGERYIYEAEMEAYDYTNGTGSTVSGYMAGGHIYINGLGYLDIVASGSGHITTPQLYLNNVDIVPYLSDSGWLNLPLTSAWTAYNASRTPKYRRVGKLVHISGAIKPTSELAAGTTSTFATLPAGFRPAQQEVAICQGTSSNLWLLTVESNGNCVVQRYRNPAGTNIAIPTTHWLPFSVSFFVA